MTTPEASPRSFVGSAIMHAVQTLRRAKYEQEATELEAALQRIGEVHEQLDVVPEHLRESLDAYIETGRPTGGFLACVLRNDLSGAMGRADETSRRALYAIVRYLRENAPTSCWGSVEAVNYWLAMPSDERSAIVNAFRGYEIVDEPSSPPSAARE